MKETIQDVLQLILQADDIKYVKNSGILNYGLDLKQVVEREIELSVCKDDKEILLAMNYDIEQCSVQYLMYLINGLPTQTRLSGSWIAVNKVHSR